MSSQRARGYALLVMLLLMATMGGVYLTHALNRNYSSSTMLREQREAQRGLRDAQLALMAHALIEDNTPGTLPSPSPVDRLDGRSGWISYSGAPGLAASRLPWHFLGLPAEINGECLWYAVSNAYHNNPSTGNRKAASGTAINPTTQGGLSVSLNSAGPIAAAAVVIAPGSALANQNARNYGNPDSCSGGSVDQFLEGGNAGINGVFADTSANPASNDHVLPITHTQLLSPVLRRVLGSLSSDPVRAEIIKRMDAANGNLDQLRCKRATPTDTCTTHKDFDAILAQTDTGELDYTGDCPGVSTADGKYKQPVSWLCFNNWYPYIAYDQASQSLSVSLAPYGSSQCRLALGTGQIQCSH